MATLFDFDSEAYSVAPRSEATMCATAVQTGSMLTTYIETRPQAAMPILRTMVERLRETKTLLSQRAAAPTLDGCVCDLRSDPATMPGTLIGP